METELQAIADQGSVIWNTIAGQIRNLTLPSRYSQITILVVGLGLAWAFRHWLGHRLREWMRARSGWPKWRLRALVILEKRLGLVIFAAFA